MNKVLAKILPIIFGQVSVGGALETFRIMTSNASDIEPQRMYLIIMSLTIFVIMLSLKLYFWRKAKD